MLLLWRSPLQPPVYWLWLVDARYFWIFCHSPNSISSNKLTHPPYSPFFPSWRANTTSSSVQLGNISLVVETLDPYCFFNRPTSPSSSIDVVGAASDFSPLVAWPLPSFLTLLIVPATDKETRLETAKCKGRRRAPFGSCRQWNLSPQSCTTRQCSHLAGSCLVGLQAVDEAECVIADVVHFGDSFVVWVRYSEGEFIVEFDR
jgi:hypothetical protein